MTTTRSQCSCFTAGQVFQVNYDLMEINKHKTKIKEQQERIAQLKGNVKELEGVAEYWMNDYQKLKDKYEPEVMIESASISTTEATDDITK